MDNTGRGSGGAGGFRVPYWRYSIELTRIARIPRLHTLDSLIAYRDYRLLWIGNFCGNSAQWMQLLTVGWLVRELTAGSSSSALLVVTIGGLNTLPGLLIGPWGGVLGDRVDRRKLIMTCQGIMAVAAFSFALLVSTGIVEVWHAYAYVILSGVFFSITHPLRQALIANTVPREALGNALAANVFTITGTRAIGPFIGGFLIASLGFFWNFTVEALFYVGMILSLLAMKTPYYEGRPAGSRRASPLANLREGIAYVWKDNRVLLNLIVLSLIPNAVLQPFMFLLPVFTDEVLGRGADIGGVLLSMTGFGGFIAAFIIASVGFPTRKGIIVLATAATSSLCVILLSQAYWLALAIVIVGLLGTSQAAFRTTTGTLIQSLVSDSLRVRITSLQQYGRGFVVLSSLLVGWFAGVTSVGLALIAVGGIGLALSLYAAAVLHRVRQQE